MKTAYDVIIRPIITEQSMEDLDIKKYAFELKLPRTPTTLRSRRRARKSST